MNKQTKNIKTIIIHESVIASLVKDMGTFAMFAALLYFNHMFLSGNGWIDFLFIILALAQLASRESSTVYSGTREGAIGWLEKFNK